MTQVSAPEKGSTYNDLCAAIEKKTAVAGIIGLGYVGLPLAEHLCRAGYRVIGFDIDETKVTQLAAGKSYIKHIDPGWIADSVKQGNFEATTDFSRLAEADCISICVPTPLSEHNEPDLRFVEETTAAVARTLRPGQLIILESTTYPGTTAEVMQPMLEAAGLSVGKDFFLVYSPEREDPGNAAFNMQAIPKVLGGVTERCREVGAAFYGHSFDRVIEVSSPAAAEMTKLLENIFRAVNIALVNELKVLCDRMGIDVWEVIEAAGTKPFGFMRFYPGPGLGGHCIPIDPFYLSWKAKEYDLPTRFIELAGEINTRMPQYVITRLMEALNERGLPLKGSRVLVLGLAYKKDIDDTRESPSLRLIELLLQHGAEVSYHDPFWPTFPSTRKYHFSPPFLEVTPENLEAVDCVLISTAHSEYDYEAIVRHAPLVLDTRNATATVSGGRGNIVKA